MAEGRKTVNNERKAGRGLGCFGGSSLTILLIVAALRIGYYWNIQNQNQAAAATEAVCHFAGFADHYVGQQVCLRGPVATVQMSPKFVILFAVRTTNNYRPVAAVSETNSWEGINAGMCVNVWGQVYEISDAYLLKIDSSKPVRVFAGQDC